MKRQILISLSILLSIQTFAAAAVFYVPKRTHPTIQDAIDAANDGDVIIAEGNPQGTYGGHVYNGTYSGEGNHNIDFKGKAITLRSKHPDDPSCVAETIIDCGGEPYRNPDGDTGAANRAFYFHNYEDPNSKVLGFTIINGYARGPKGKDGDPNIRTPVPYEPIVPKDFNEPPWAERGKPPLPDPVNGFNGYGGAILCESSSPTIRYCVIKDCIVTGALGGRGADGNDGAWVYKSPLPEAEEEWVDDGQWGGHGSEGSGNGYGGAIACRNKYRSGFGSNPLISDCIFENNFARGGCGGDGGDGGEAADEGTNGDESWGGSAGDSIGDGIGGAIYSNEYSRPVFTNCISISNNTATTGFRATGGSKGKGGSSLDPPAENGRDGQVLPTGGIAGGAAYFSCDSSFTNCKFINNRAYEAFWWHPSLDSSWVGGDITAYNIGGALYSGHNNSVTLDGCEFTGNMGGAVYCKNGCDVHINDSQFTDNSDPNDFSNFPLPHNFGFSHNPGDFGSGGALFVDYNASVVELTDCVFVGNSAKNEGGAVKCRSDITLTDCSFGGNESGGYGGAIDLYFGAIAPLTIDANGCSFTVNKSQFGGSFSSEIFIATFTDCYFIGNTAERGGGLDLVDGDVSITGGVINGNNATEFDGGGLSCRQTAVVIRDCTMADNIADGVIASGGAINFDGAASAHQVRNCLMTGNSATVYGGAIYCYETAPDINNCTFSENSAGSCGGAIYSDFRSLPEITNSIFHNCNKAAICEKAEIDEANNGDAIVTYCLFHDNPGGDYYDSVEGPIGDVNEIPGGSNNYDDSGFPTGELLFESGDLGAYYLNQSLIPPVDSGSALASDLGLDTYTTNAKNNSPDSGQVDIGYHYIDSVEADTFQLEISVIGGEGTIAPESGGFYAGTTVTLLAEPATGWRVKAWSGTDNDFSTDETNAVTMSWHKTVTVEFDQPRLLEVGPDGDYSTIQNAVFDAVDGDIVVVDTGTWYDQDVYLDKSITIRSKHPDDFACVAATIIDKTGNVGACFVFYGETKPTLNGFTIQNCRWNPISGKDGDRDKGHPDGYDGMGASGAALSVWGGANPTIRNCIFRNNSMTGAAAGNGVPATSTQNAGRGGWGGWGRGGAIYCGWNSGAAFINCQIVDNEAHGGKSGNGGNHSGDDGTGNYGGGWSTGPGYHIDPFSLCWYLIDGNLWEYWGYIGDYRWVSGYGGGVYCDVGSTVTFIDCAINGNRTYGGISGIGGTTRAIRRSPVTSYEIPSFGGGVYCAANSTVTFVDCSITDNIASAPSLADPNDPNSEQQYHLDPYLGHGGGVCAEDTATVIFTNCEFSDNEVPGVGGGLYFSDANPRISDCEFTQNSAYHGGGVLGIDGPGIIIGCNITDNEAVSYFEPNSPDEVLGEGGGLHLWATDVEVIDCNINDNRADASGGGIYLGGGNAPSLINCLVRDNIAERDGGGVSANTYSQPTISNCTIIDNIVTGIGFHDNYGGGLYCSYENNTDVINSIIWGNQADNGSQVAIGTGFEHDQAPSEVSISYSDIQGGAIGIFVETGCILNGYDPNDPNSITNLTGASDDNPLFVSGELGDYYLSQPDTNDPNQTELSPCVDVGSDDANSLGFYRHTTRTDGALDTNTVDLGYYYILTTEFVGDLNFDGKVDLRDLGILTGDSFPEEGCEFPDWCQGRDLNQDGRVDNSDYSRWAGNYGDPTDPNANDNTPPTPNPMTWAVAPVSVGPNSITMTATTAIDNSGAEVEYYFECVYGFGNNRGWDVNTTYVDVGLDPNSEKYGYRVRARDEMGDDNKTDWSFIGYAITGESGGGPEPGAAEPPEWVLPYTATPNSITVEVTTYDSNDVAYVDYYFEETSGGQGGSNSGWQSSAIYEDTGLDPNTTYTYRVRARDENGKTTDWSSVLSAITLGEGQTDDTEPPVTDSGAADPYKSTFAEKPSEYFDGGMYHHKMTATTATDATGPVEYKFICYNSSSASSDWQTSTTYDVVVGAFGHDWLWQVQTRDRVTPTPNYGHKSDYWSTYGNHIEYP